jgi:hypothetical protein
MPTRGFQPGFRISVFDGLVLALGVLGSVLTWPRAWWLGFVIAFVLGHFFLFCNVFRISRALELIWAVVFILLTRLTVTSGWLSWTATILLSLATTLVVVGLELRKPSYHGIGWSRVNPGLRQWWESSHQAADREAASGS